MKRTIDFHLDKWITSPQRKVLLLRGARQVGKTWSVRNLAAKFKYFVEVNFEADRSVHQFFRGDLDPAEICANLAGAATILGASVMGIPVSTTHIICTSIMGVGTTMGASTVKWGVARSIALAWILTIPISALIGFVAFVVIRLIVGS